jgi:hypothetical protein
MVQPSPAVPSTLPRPKRRFSHQPNDSPSPDSPSKNTCSRVQVSASDIPSVLVSPPKRHKKDEPNDDLAVWDKSDDIIIGMYSI